MAAALRVAGPVAAQAVSSRAANGTRAGARIRVIGHSLDGMMGQPPREWGDLVARRLAEAPRPLQPFEPRTAQAGGMPAAAAPGYRGGHLRGDRP